MRVAYLSPLPPQRSGIADYSAELIPYLAEHVELELFTDRPGESREALAGDWPVAAVGELSRRASSYDLALYHLGNNPDFHGSIHAVLHRHPGVVVLHEFMLHHLIQGLTLARADPAAYVEEMRYCYGVTGRKLAERHVATGMPIDVWRYPLFERVVDRSLALVVHNEFTRRRVEASRPDALIEVVPHHLALGALDEAPEGDEMRSRLGIPADAFLVGSFGFVTPHKRLEVSLRAFARLRREHPGSRFVVAGEVSPYYDVGSLLDGELGEGVVVTGRLELPDLLAAMRACDVAVNLRYPSGGETSGTLMRLLGLGKAVVVSNEGSFAEVPDGCCAKLDIDASEPAVLAAFLKKLAAEPELRRRMGACARRHMERRHTLEGSAAAYAAFLERLAGAGVGPFEAAPPLAPDDERPVYGELVAAVGRAVADLGRPDSDDDLLSELAGMLVELDLDRSARSDGAR